MNFESISELEGLSDSDSSSQNNTCEGISYSSLTESIDSESESESYLCEDEGEKRDLHTVYRAYRFQNQPETARRS